MKEKNYLLNVGENLAIFLSTYYQFIKEPFTNL